MSPRKKTKQTTIPNSFIRSALCRTNICNSCGHKKPTHNKKKRKFILNTRQGFSVPQNNHKTFLFWHQTLASPIPPSPSMKHVNLQCGGCSNCRRCRRCRRTRCHQLYHESGGDSSSSSTGNMSTESARYQRHRCLRCRRIAAATRRCWCSIVELGIDG